MENIKQYESIDIKKRCYVYPSGGCALACVNILRDCLFGVEFIMLDDGKHETSLEANKGVIVSSGDYLLVCAGDVQEELLEKCRELEIKKSIDGREYTAFLLANAIKREIDGQSPKFEILENGRVLHVFDNKWITHFYYFYDLFAYYLSNEWINYIVKFVEKYCDKIKNDINADRFYGCVEDGYFIVYVKQYFKSIASKINSDELAVYFGSWDYYSQNRSDVEKYQVLICPWILISFMICRKVAFLMSGLIPENLNREYKSVGSGHIVCEAFQFFPKKMSEDVVKRYVSRYFKNFDYYLSIDKASTKAFEKIFQACNIETRILAAGSLSLDSKKEIRYNGISGFYFIPLLNGKECVSVISKLLKRRKKVIFRPHHAYLVYAKQYKIKNPYAYCDEFKGDSNFVLDLSEKISEELLTNSIVITDNSSLSYSAPLSTLNPAILFAPPKKEFDLRVRNFGMSFEDPILHRVALSVEECVDVALQLEKDLSSENGTILRENIKRYRDANLYNQGKAAEAIAEILKDIADGKI